MNHYADPGFWRCYASLPGDVRQAADRAFERLRSDPRHPSLHLKKVGHYWSARVGRYHRALAVESEDSLIWFWIGSHAEYDQRLR
ncbi:MAG: hypothetical protein P9C48_12020 [Defluviicoccus sp.]|nr:hypothetical protein [Defluviicoccus sp.]MDG4609845.1 hypothetical protein [Defluviicoccus sp.]